MTWRVHRPVRLLLSVATLAVVVRLAAVVAGGGLRGLMGYDDGVYFAGADAMVSGRVPYRDFVLLHPPGILLALAPFAELGHLTSDSTGLAAARLAFIGVGALNAALVARIAWRFGPVAAVVGGVFYAVWTPALYSEHTTLLEPLAGTALLTCVLLLGSEGGRGRRAVVAGALLGVACTFKIWYVAPALVVVGWQLAAAGRRTALRMVLAGAASVSLLWAPFLALAPRQMLHMAVLDQLGRPAAKDRLVRLASMAGVSARGAEGRVEVVLIGALVVAAAVVAARTAGARVFVALLVVNGLVLLASPSYFPHYAVLVAAPLALTLAVAVGELTSRSRGGPPLLRAAAAGACGAVVLTLVATRLTHGYGEPIPRERFREAVASSRCVVADEPGTLAVLDVLSRDLSRGCPVPVDLTGITYDRDAEWRRDGRHVSRTRNQAWQQDLRAYLSSGQTLILTRRAGTGMGPELKLLVRRLPVIASGDGLQVKAVGPLRRS